MAYYHNNKLIKAGQAWTASDGTQHPKQWNAAWSEEEKLAAGLEKRDDPVVTNYDRRFYWENGTPRILEDRAEVNEDGTPMLDENGEQMITKGLKSNAIALVKRQAGDILANTDWMVTRFTENNTKPIPADVAAYRDMVRTKSNEIEQLINACTTLEQFMALYETPVDADGMPTGNAPIVDWPEA